ncbi:hypothetical protein [Alkalimonas amylolytica]|uniref:Cell division inhibitor SulA n=1 Tax=Alkalimonas amylolytica TaxID=152573 RepID=A0A1H4AYK3_ALKAM|nr:hypothetical protein [Alkalimonas amylolytica]SEA40985.1 hypothetical protein SAMN04488051_10386 [Alkalimonas amylolytica]
MSSPQSRKQTSMNISNQPGLHYCLPSAEQQESRYLHELLQQQQHAKGWTLILAPETTSLKVLADMEVFQQSRTLLIHRKQIQDLAGTLKKAILAGTCSCIINFAELTDLQQTHELSLLAESCGCAVYCFTTNTSWCH